MMMDSPWRSQDKDWKRERTALWKMVKGNLELLVDKTRLRRSDFKHHRELFFEGTIHGRPLEDLDAMSKEYRTGWPDGEWDTPPLDAFHSMFPVYWMWYHPEVNSLDLDELRAVFYGRDFLANVHGLFHTEWMRAGAVPPEMVPVDYGLMGGREGKMVDLLFAGVDHREPAPGSYPKGQKPSSGPTLQNASCMRPGGVFRDCLYSSETELKQDARFYPYSAGQFLWPHLSAALQQYPDKVLGKEETGEASRNRRELQRLIAEILGFQARTDASRQRPSTIAMVERVIALQKFGEFSEALDEIWSEAAANTEELIAESEELGTFSMAEPAICKRYGVRWPVKDQRARVEAWLSV